MKENGFTLKNGKKQTIPRTNYYGCRLRRWFSASGKYTTQAESLLCCLEQAAGGIDLHVNADKTAYMCFDKKEISPTLNGGSLKLVNKFIYLTSSLSSTENDMNVRLAKA